MRQRWFTGGWVERGDFGHDFGLDAIQEFLDRRHSLPEAAIAVSGSMSRGVDSGDFERMCRALPLQQSGEGAAYVAITD